MGNGPSQEHPPIKGPLYRNDLQSSFLQIWKDYPRVLVLVGFTTLCHLIELPIKSPCLHNSFGALFIP
jgi:hypothetical protein